MVLTKDALDEVNCCGVLSENNFQLKNTNVLLAYSRTLIFIILVIFMAFPMLF